MLIAPGATAYLLTDRFRPHADPRAADRGGRGLRGRLCQLLPRRARWAAASCFLQTALFLARLAPGAETRRSRAAPGAARGARRRRDGCCDFLVGRFTARLHGQGDLVGALVCAVCAALSCFIVLKGWSLIGDAISHAVLPGIVLAHLLGVPMALGAVASGILCVQAAGGVSGTSRVKPDAALGILFTGFLALGMVLVTAFPSGIDFTHVLFGNLLGITDSDLAQALILGGLALATWRSSSGAISSCSASIPSRRR